MRQGALPQPGIWSAAVTLVDWSGTQLVEARPAAKLTPITVTPRIPMAATVSQRERRRRPPGAAMVASAVAASAAASPLDGSAVELSETGSGGPSTGMSCCGPVSIDALLCYS
jgi:hypothetical protein